MVSIRVKKACCCLSLRTGNLIVGWLGLISSIALLVTIVAVTVAGEKEILGNEPHIKEVLTELPEKKEETRVVLVIVIVTVVCLANALVFIAHLYGTYKYRKSYLKPILILGAIQLVAVIISIVFGLVTANIDRVCSGILTFLIAFYYYLVPWSFYKEIEEGHTPVEHGEAPMELR